MKAMVLTAGVGRRMSPLTLERPKPCLPVLGRPLVVQVLHRLSGYGIRDVVLNLHHMPDAIVELLGDGSHPQLPTVAYSREPVIQGTAGGIRDAAPMLGGDGPIIVCNADSLGDIDLNAALKTHLASGCLATLVLAPSRPAYTPVVAGADGRIVSIGGEPPIETEHDTTVGLYTGTQIIERELIDHIPKNGPSNIVSDVWRPLMAKGMLGSHAHRGFWWEFGSPRLYLEGCLRLLEVSSERRREIVPVHDPVRPLASAVASIGAGARWEPTAKILGRTSLGFLSFVSENAEVEDSVVMSEAWIGADCRLRRSVVARAVELPSGFEVEDAVVYDDPGPAVELPPRTRRQSGLLVHPLDCGE